MPVHRVIRLDLEDAVRRFETKHERVTQILPESDGTYLVVTETDDRTVVTR